MINPIPVHNVGELSRNYLPYKIMKEFIVVSDHLLVKLVEKVLGKESRTLFIGNNSLYRAQCVELKLSWQFCVHASACHEIYL